jgi:hypothetical protein
VPDGNYFDFKIEPEIGLAGVFGDHDEAYNIREAVDALNAAYHAGRESVMAVLRDYRQAQKEWDECDFEDLYKIEALAKAKLAADELLNPKPPTQWLRKKN